MRVLKLLIDTLENLRRDDFDTFRFYLSENVLDGCIPIPPSHVENASRAQTARKMIESYGEDSAVKVTAEILKEMNCNGPKQELESRYAEIKSATPSSSSSSSSSSSAAAPAPPAAMTAQHRSVIIAPNVAGGTSGTWNITNNTCWPF